MTKQLKLVINNTISIRNVQLIRDITLEHKYLIGEIDLFTTTYPNSNNLLGCHLSFWLK